MNSINKDRIPRPFANDVIIRRVGCLAVTTAEQTAYPSKGPDPWCTSAFEDAYADKTG
jgi:hypothetical protein